MLSAPVLAQAGPVPGEATFNKQVVEFPYPKHLEVWDIGDDKFLVTFNWTPEEPLEEPGVAGTFNGWNRVDLPMNGPDENGNL